ncbi:MAG: hypothetical protein ACOC56_00205 [Atribacterota bacterium]
MNSFKDHVCGILKHFATIMCSFQYFEDFPIKQNRFEFIRDYMVRRIVVCNQHLINNIIFNRRKIIPGWNQGIEAVVNEIEPTISDSEFNNVVKTTKFKEYDLIGDWTSGKNNVCDWPFDLENDWRIIYSLLKRKNKGNSEVLNEMAERGMYLGYILKKEIEDKKIIVNVPSIDQKNTLNNKACVFHQAISKRTILSVLKHPDNVNIEKLSKVVGFEVTREMLKKVAKSDRLKNKKC